MVRRKINRYERAYLRKKQRQLKSQGIKVQKNTLLRHVSRKIDLAGRSFFKKISLSLNNKMSDIKKIRKHIVHKRKQGAHKVHENPKHTKGKKLKVKKSKKKGSWFLRFLKRSIVLALVLFVVGAGSLLVWFSTLEIPDVDNFEKRKISNSTKIYDRTGEILLYDIHKDIRRTVVGNDQIAQSAKDAIIAIEDHTFYEHKGVVISSTVKAVVQTVLSKLNLTSAGVAGGSTLTQQVIKNTLLTRDRDVSRKMKEWFLAYKIEQKLSKDDILRIYLNEAPYGGTIYGIEEASQVFFGKTAKDLTIAESAYLAAIPNLPTFYSPYGSNTEALRRRQRTVLTEMKRYGYITDTEYRESLEEEVNFLPREATSAKALHFVQYVREYLESKYGVDLVENGGLKVISSLDYKLQQEAESIIFDHVDEVKDQYDASNAALVAIENETGQIITMVGSRSYYDTDGFDGNFNVAISPRQPGSSFKPFAYASVFEKGLYPESNIFDTQTQFNSRCEKDDFTSKGNCYSPKNYDNDFKGVMTLRTALAQSRNIPALKMAHLGGVSNIIQKAQEMGISSLNRGSNHYGLGLVLGGGEVSLLEMVSAYTTFPNDGRHAELTPVIEIKDVDGNILENYTEKSERVFSRDAARMVNSVLSDNDARTPLFGSRSFLYFGKKDVAGKTGTTNDNRDAWLIGYSSDVSVGVWTGNNDNSPMKKGSSISGKPWRAYMDKVNKVYDTDDFKLYDIAENFSELPTMVNGNWQGDLTYQIDGVSGLLATEFTPIESQYTLTKFDPHTILHWVSRSDLDLLDTSRSDSQYENWEYGVQEYSKENFADLLEFNFDIPTEYDNVHDENGLIDSFDFDIEKVDSLYRIDDDVRLKLDLDGISKSDVESIQVSVNNAFVGQIDPSELDFEFEIDEIRYRSTKNIIRVTIVDEDGLSVSRTAEFRIE